MKLKDLKQRALESWTYLRELETVLVQPECFKPEMRQRFGDLRRKSTWEQAYIALQAEELANSEIANHQLISWWFCHPDQEVVQQYNDRILDAFLKFPDSLERLQDGLERLYHQPTQPSDRQDAIDFLNRLVRLEKLDALPARAIAAA